MFYLKAGMLIAACIFFILGLLSGKNKYIKEGALCGIFMLILRATI